MQSRQWHFWFASRSSGCGYFQSWPKDPCLSGGCAPAFKRSPSLNSRGFAEQPRFSSPSEIYGGFRVEMWGRGCLTEVFPNGSHMSSWWSGKGENIQTRWGPRWASCGKWHWGSILHFEICSDVPLQVFLSCVCFGARKLGLNQRQGEKKTCRSCYKKHLSILWLTFVFYPKRNTMISWGNLFMMRCEINKLRPMGGDRSAAQMGQHSPNGISGLGQSFSSSQTISSHRTVPVSHTQMRQGSGFHTSLSL